MLGGPKSSFFMSLLFPDKAEDCGAVREAFILSLSHCGGREGSLEMVFLFGGGGGGGGSGGADSEAGTHGGLLYLC